MNQDMAFCVNCGSVQEESSKFCAQCGHSVGATHSTKETEVKSPIKSASEVEKIWMIDRWAMNTLLGRVISSLYGSDNWFEESQFLRYAMRGFIFIVVFCIAVYLISAFTE